MKNINMYKTNRHKALCLIAFFTTFAVSAQIDEFSYKRELSNITEQWHKIILPDDIYEKTSVHLSDLRIFGIVENGDTIEVPYVLQKTTGKILDKEISFKIINTSHDDNGFYFTLEIPSSNTINYVNLDFEQNNFDWRLKLEGSDNRHDWFTIVDDYRIVSIKNSETSYSFTNVAFPDSKYRYLRFFIPCNEKPILNKASLLFKEATEGEYRTFPHKLIEKKSEKRQRQTAFEIDLNHRVPVSYIKFNIASDIDYYRPVSITYLLDSTKIDKRWVYHNHDLISGTITSFEKNEFHLNNTLARKLNVYIDNNDNQPLTINSFEIKGNIPDMAVRFSEQGKYFLVYGNNEIRRPNYDMEQFRDKIPDNLTALTLGEEQIMKKAATLIDKSLLKNKAWLWAVMIVIILLLGWSSVKMIKKS